MAIHAIHRGTQWCDSEAYAQNKVKNQERKFNKPNCFCHKTLFFKPLIINGLFFAKQSGNPFKPRPVVAWVLVKPRLSTKLSTDFVDSFKSAYETWGYRNM